MAEVGLHRPERRRASSPPSTRWRSRCATAPTCAATRRADDFGKPETAFNICTFWRIDALARIGRKAQAREIFEVMLESRNPLGLLSEDTHPVTGEMWGNFPQTYSMVGLINAAVRLSAPWDTVDLRELDAAPGRRLQPRGRSAQDGGRRPGGGAGATC